MGFAYNMQSSTIPLKRNIHFSEEGTPVFRNNRQPRICIKYCLTIQYDRSINVTFPDQSTDILVLKKVPGEETVSEKRKSVMSLLQRLLQRRSLWDSLYSSTQLKLFTAYFRSQGTS